MKHAHPFIAATSLILVAGCAVDPADDLATEFSEGQSVDDAVDAYVSLMEEGPIEGKKACKEALEVEAKRFDDGFQATFLVSGCAKGQTMVEMFWRPTKEERADGVMDGWVQAPDDEVRLHGLFFRDEDQPRAIWTRVESSEGRYDIQGVLFDTDEPRFLGVVTTY